MSLLLMLARDARKRAKALREIGLNRSADEAEREAEVLEYADCGIDPPPAAAAPDAEKFPAEPRPAGEVTGGKPP